MLVLKHFLDIRTIIWITSYIIGWMFYIQFTCFLILTKAVLEFKQNNCIMSYLRLLRFLKYVLSMKLKCPCLWNFHVSAMSMSLKCPCLWNGHCSEMSISLKCPCFWKVHVTEMSMSLKCPVSEMSMFLKCPCLWNVLSLKCQCLKCPTPFLLSFLKISYRWGPGGSHLWQI